MGRITKTEAIKLMSVEITQLKAELNEADRRAGAAERLLANLEIDMHKLRSWRDEQKRKAGYMDFISFDVVWKEILEKAQLYDKGLCAVRSIQHEVKTPSQVPSSASAILTPQWVLDTFGDGPGEPDLTP
ncbi:hypothetical protein [Hymenobacter sp. YC55]|uniref:hypothetical protein n=1 Tax=Hymenobacter sp. YC55 TaxID=3034019 RepID=UPI0023F916CF|nr:hypothetical protein [Hymenobacter sp. YC55]MDF7810720.1 hypothetical protein [Hymenobacter sp. YC55]